MSLGLENLNGGFTALRTNATVDGNALRLCPLVLWLTVDVNLHVWALGRP